MRTLCWLGCKPTGGVFYGSDYFDNCYEFAVKLIKDGKAYVDDLSAEEMTRIPRHADRAGHANPPCRGRSVEENLDLFERMKNGEFPDGSHTLRAKIDMASPNMNMRDPAIYRILAHRSITVRATNGASILCMTMPIPFRTRLRG